MAIKDKIKKYVKKVLPFLVLLVPFTVSATRVSIDLTGTLNNSSVTKQMYVNYDHANVSVSLDDNGDPLYDHVFSFFLELRSFAGSQSQKTYSGVVRSYLKATLTSSDYISSYIEAPFYTEDNVTASVELTTLSNNQFRFDVVTTLDNYYVESSIPLVQLNFHVITSSSVIPAFSNFSNPYTSASGSYFRLSETDDLATIIAAAIDDSVDVDSIIAILTHISSQSDLLTNVLTKVTNLDNTLSVVLTHVNAIDNHNEAIELLLMRLYRMISGITQYNDIGNISMDIQAFQNYWMDIISQALQYTYLLNSQDAQRANVQNIEVQDVESTLHSLESGYFDSYNSAANNITWNPVAPARVVSVATWVISFLDALYNKLDSIKFLITVSLTMGILILVLGSALRYYRRGR